MFIVGGFFVFIYVLKKRNYFLNSAKFLKTFTTYVMLQKYRFIPW